MLEVNAVVRHQCLIRIGIPVAETDILAAIVVEILRFNHVVSLAERVEVVGHQDAVAERIGRGNNGHVDGIGQERINHILGRGRAGDHQVRGDVAAIEIQRMPLAGKLLPSAVTVKLKALVDSNGCVPVG